MKKREKIKLNIGIPVFNSEKSIRKCLDSLLCQTFSDFEIIISDNASTDNTSNICKEYQNKDSRIKFFQQKSNIQIIGNFNFVLNESNTEYFMWAAGDDIWHPEFIEKNLEFLEKNPNFVGSTSEIEYFSESWIEKDFEKFKNIKSKRKYEFVHPLIGNYEEKIKFLFRVKRFEYVYAIYRKKYLKKSMTKNNFVCWEVPFILKILKYGDIHVEDGIMMFKSNIVKSDPAYFKKLYSNTKKQGLGILHCLFPFFPLTVNVFLVVGAKIFFKNLFTIFIRDNYRAERLVFLEIVLKK